MRGFSRQERGVDDTLYDELRTTVGDAGIIELTILIGYYIMLTTVVHAVDLPLEDGVLAIPFPEP
jgi:hypothetical protein